jgi:hypothetical protein
MGEAGHTCSKGMGNAPRFRGGGEEGVHTTGLEEGTKEGGGEEGEGRGDGTARDEWAPEPAGPLQGPLHQPTVAKCAK